MASKAISVELGTKQQAILRQQLDSGRYENANEVVNDALRLMSERDAVLDEWLRGEIAAVVADKRPPVPAEGVFKRLESRHVRRVKAAKRAGK